MTKPSLRVHAAAAIALAIMSAPSGAWSQNLIQNGDFSALGTLNGTSSRLSNATPLPGWTATSVGANGGIGCVMIGVSNPATATPMCGTSYGSPSGAPYSYGTLAFFPGTPPGGGNVYAGDGAAAYAETISQTISGLTVGAQYTLTFYQAAAQQTGPTYTGSSIDQWKVSFGTKSQFSTAMNVAQQSGVNWASQTMIFTANSVSQVMTFLATASANAQPPILLLGDVSLKAVATPEPASVALLGIGFAGVAALRRKRARRQVSVDGDDQGIIKD